MKKIVINSLYTTELKPFIDDLDVIEIDIVSGGMWGSYPYSGLNPGVSIMTTYDGINSMSKTYEGAGNFHDNKFNTTDYGRTVNAWVSR
ncbi:MAG: hypothetical protein AN490_11500 [Anabaena sp. AL09]|jgi:purine nucleoside permease|nr:MAG: hypothetical protein AN490_11500 [Anabaena sp. AL09]